MGAKKHKKSLYENISDVIFVPKRKSLTRRVLFIFLIVLLGGSLLTAYLYSQGYFRQSNIAINNTSPTTYDDSYKTVETFVRKPCGIDEPGDEHYTDWFKIHSNAWKIFINSERVNENELANVRVWYTQSSEPILEGGVYKEVGEGHPNYDSGNKSWEEELSGSGRYRLRILCWNSNYSIEVKER